jgi:threonine dehydrogenase-like Zn-dependent dehydrogenase
MLDVKTKGSVVVGGEGPVGLAAVVVEALTDSMI